MQALGLTKKIVFINNKGGVGKTTLCYNVGASLAHQGYKVLLVDADPQCNLTLQTLGMMRYSELGLFEHQTIYHVVEPMIKAIGDVNMNIQPLSVSDDGNLSILPGHLYFGDFDDLLGTSFVEAAQGQERGFIRTSALNRYLDALSRAQNYDFILIDTSPSLTGALNRMLLLTADFFITIARPDLFSLQGVRHLGEKLKKRKEDWRIVKQIVKADPRVSFTSVLEGNPYFIGYIVNEYNVYAHQAIQIHQEWMQKMREDVKDHLSAWHCINGLGELSWQEELGQTQDYGQLASLAQNQHLPIWSLDQSLPQGSEKLLQKCREEYQVLIERLIYRIGKRGR